MCQQCLDAKKSKREARLARAECSDCYGKTYNKKPLCPACRARKTERARERRLSLGAIGKCYVCKANAVPSSTRCETCIFKEKAKSHLGSPNQWKTIKAIWESQSGTCPYTGISLSLTTSDVDHIVPRSKNGKGEPSNLQFVLAQINKMKNDYEEDDFLSLIQTMYKHCVRTGKIRELDETKLRLLA
jgi:5-methylcytosine-specific restriction endonuclease McrA